MKSSNNSTRVFQMAEVFTTKEWNAFQKDIENNNWTEDNLKIIGQKFAEIDQEHIFISVVNNDIRHFSIDNALKYVLVNISGFRSRMHDIMYTKNHVILVQNKETLKEVLEWSAENLTEWEHYVVGYSHDNTSVSDYDDHLIIIEDDNEQLVFKLRWSPSRQTSA